MVFAGHVFYVGHLTSGGDAMITRSNNNNRGWVVEEGGGAARLEG